MAGQDRVYLYCGGPRHAVQYSCQLLQPTYTVGSSDPYGHAFGQVVVPAGDVDADGYADLLITSPYAYVDVGRADLLRGGASGVALAGSTQLAGVGVTFAGFGTSAAGVGDIDGDGFDDVVVGEPFDASATMPGNAYLFRGSAGGLRVSPAIVLHGLTPGDGFGDAVAGADFDGDGYDDVAVGARRAGIVYVFRGGPTGLAATPAWTLVGPGGVSSAFGSAVATSLDSNADGYADLVIGAPNELSGVGRAYFYAGGPIGLAPMPTVTMHGTSSTAGNFGQSLASL